MRASMPGSVQIYVCVHVCECKHVPACLYVHAQAFLHGAHAHLSLCMRAPVAHLLAHAHESLQEHVPLLSAILCLLVS